MANIRRYIIEIIITIVFVIITVPIWDSFTNNSHILSAYNSINVVLDFDGFSMLTNSDKDNYKTIKPSNISIRNITDEKQNYSLYYTYAKKSTIPYDDLFISINDNIYSLNEIKYIEDSDYYYFLIESNDLDGYSTRNEETRIWTNADRGSLSGTFILM